VTCLVFLTVAAGYATGLRLMVRLDPAADSEAVDGRYFGIHGITLVVAGLAGFALGTYFRRMGFAFATLFLTAIVIVMIAAQVASFELACAGHNDVIRHWHC
jgi:hypothetical protein